MDDILKGLPRWVRLVAMGTAAVVAVALVGPRFIPIDRIRLRVIEQVYAATGRTLSIDGPISFRLLPWPQVSIEKVALSNPPGGMPEPMLTAYRIVAVPSLTSLLRGHTALDELRIELPELNLSRDGEGHPNWRFLKPPKGKKAAAIPVRGPAATLVKVAYVPAAAPEPMMSAQTVAEITAPSPARAADDQAQKEDPMERFARKMADVPLPSYLPVKQIVITNGRINYQRGAASRKRAQIDGLMLLVSLPSMAAPISVSGSALWKDTRWHLGIELSSLPGLLTATGSRLQGSLKGAAGYSTIDGVAALGGTRPRGKLAVKAEISPQIPTAMLSDKMRRMVEAVSAGGNGGRVSLQADFDGKRLVLDDCSITLGDAAKGECTLAVGFGGAVPEISGGIVVDHLDLDRFLKAPKAEEPDPTSLATVVNRPEKQDKTLYGRQPKKWKTKRLLLDRLGKIDADISIKVASAQIRQTDIGPVDLQLLSHDGHAEFNLNGTVGGAIVAIHAAADAPAPDQPPHTTLTVAIKNLVLDPFLASGRGVFKRGLADIDGHFDSIGDNQRDLIGNLNGRLALSLVKADLRFYRVSAAWLKTLAPDPSACPTVLEDATAKAELTVTNGVIDIESLSIFAPNFGVTVEGPINLPTRSMNLKVGGGGQPCIASARMLGLIDSPAFER